MKPYSTKISETRGLAGQDLSHLTQRRRDAKTQRAKTDMNTSARQWIGSFKSFADRLVVRLFHLCASAPLRLCVYRTGISDVRVQLSKPDFGRPGADAGCRNVDVLRGAIDEGAGAAVGAELRRAGRPEG